MKLVTLLCVFITVAPLYALTNEEIESHQKEISGRPIGERIAFWAERFVGTPYDSDPLGNYVTKKVIVADESADCMYLSFRALELAIGSTPEEALNIALDKRFVDRGVMKDGRVSNYESRFQYGEDMIDSGKWGKEITRDIGPTASIRGAKGKGRAEIIIKEALVKNLKENRYELLKSGDFIFFIKPDGKRIKGEIVGHIGILKREGNTLHLIHASGIKSRGGEVQKVLFSNYINSMPFVGVRITRFFNP